MNLNIETFWRIHPEWVVQRKYKKVVDKELIIFLEKKLKVPKGPTGVTFANGLKWRITDHLIMKKVLK